jgi:hypothetical protein
MRNLEGFDKTSGTIQEEAGKLRKQFRRLTKRKPVVRASASLVLKSVHLDKSCLRSTERKYQQGERKHSV